MPTFNTISFMEPIKVGELVQRLREYAQDTLSAPRSAHVARVAELTEQLCNRFDVDSGRGLIAAWGHDLSREWPADELLRWAAQDGSEPSPFERDHPVLLHGRVSALLLAERFGVDDPQVLNAVRHHTLGHPGMGRLELILFVADYFEPGRSFLTPQLRAVLDGNNLDRMALAAIEDARRRRLSIAPVTAELFSALRSRVER